MEKDEEIVVEQLEVNLKLIMSVVVGLQPEHIDCLNQMVKDGQDEVSRYEAMGIMDGWEYHDKLAEKKALLARMRALSNLVQVTRETNPAIQKGKVLK